MSARQSLLWAAALALHLLLITAASLQDISASLADGASLLPASCDPDLHRVQAAAGAVLGRAFAQTNPLRAGLAAYADCAGIEAGYSYFAPSVSASSKLDFELHYADGRVEHDVPPVGGAAAGYRISTLLDHLQTVHYADLRKAVLKILVEDLHREYPGSDRIRATLQIAELPSPADYRTGARINYRRLFAYDFVFRLRPTPPAAR